MSDNKTLSFDTLTRLAIKAGLMEPRDTMSNLPAEYAGSICIFAELVAAEVRAKDGAAPQQAAPAVAYKDGTPHLSVGDSSFESWYESYNPAHKSDKQRSRDAYAAGMGDPLVAAAPQQEVQEPCPTCVSLARTVMLDQVSFDRKPDCYGIRQITDDEGVEEWEDIRTSPDVAREEANDMMATGRGEIYEVVPLWTTPQPAPSGDAKKLSQIASAIRDYHYALDMRMHGGLAESTALNAVCETMGMHWQQGAEAEARKEGPTNV